MRISKYALRLLRCVLALTAKLENLLIRNGIVKLGDLGLCVAKDNVAKDRGTPMW
jgi:hypothetical protein